MSLLKASNNKLRITVEVECLENKISDDTLDKSQEVCEFDQIIDQLTSLENENLWELVAKSREILRHRGEIID